ncbi:coiled-coil domain-containing protein 152 isoform X2 [Clupea harengus]|uniref:Coiled-coil domain-containing protein 152 isoform X2 n=1 Tax=Clupea harengus TaxID=7950 RepID=A0A6P3WG49_CLUHA|nr:coiled-coil domain-containing protein 152 isoform X2 [Clupea harengus]
MTPVREQASGDRNGLLGTIQGLQQTLQQQCDLRVENERLKKSLLDMKKNNVKILEDCHAQNEGLQAEMAVLQEDHQRELEEAQQETQRKLEAKERAIKEVIEKKESSEEELRRKIREQDKEKQSELIKLQMEFSAKLARVQSTVVKSQQAQGSSLASQNIFKRKLQFMQEEKNREIEALRQKVKELEQQQFLGFTESRLKRRKI